MFGGRKRQPGAFRADTEHDGDTSPVEKETHDAPTQAQIKRATRTRKIWSLTSSFLLFIALIFLILVEIGNVRVNGTLNDIYFLRLDISDIVPLGSVPNAVLINSVAQSLGLHDFYTVGLWNYCQGFDGQGTTSCSDTTTLYWFNPLEILQSQLLAGATINLPADVYDILDLIQIVSNIIFGFFLTGTCVTFIMMFIQPLAVFSRWASLPITIFSFINALLVVVGAIVATVLWVIFQSTVTSVNELNIEASLGIKIFVFMWIAAGAVLISFIIQLCLLCCCASRRDVRTGRKFGSKKAWIGT